MDLYLLSPPFLKRMMRRPSSAGQEAALLPLEDVLFLAEGPRLPSEGPPDEDVERNVDQVGGDAGARRGRRRSSLDRMLRQHAYIIICALCYACNSLPANMT